MQETMQVQFTSLLDHLSANRAEAVLATQFRLNELTLITDADHVVELLGSLRDDPQCRFICLLDICGVDWPARAARFDVVYHLLSPSLNLRLRVKLATDEDTPVPSACAVFACADWYEREAWTCTASCLKIIPTCAGSLPTTVSKATRFARISRLPVSSRSVTTTQRNA